ncbi:MAG TPA: resolvase [Candidatus Eubacterium faecipullorum]|uniref:Resolvase n=1 Tax=Candidatus Eubacterium faecipullorum TaxID=2838571 RepID=A0A9D1UGS0_9FIRM|nr:resolvase [Candidatus Eubacterium faecipullorum]
MQRQRIENTARQELNDEDRLELCRLLIKAGYTVRLVKEKPEGKNRYEKYIEYWEE